MYIYMHADDSVLYILKVMMEEEYVYYYDSGDQSVQS